jgi:NAD(P)-dependent dehydrogenase (short-subunit alcohol dehydrogenase family)
MLCDFSGKVAIVTGGNGGIGLGMAKGLAQAGASIVVAARNPEKSAQAVEELAALGAQAVAVGVDVASKASVQAMVQATLDRFGRLDILINNAGTNIRKQPEEYTLDEWRLILDTNLTSAFICSQAAYPALKTGRRRQDRHDRLDDVDLRRLVHLGLRCEQGRHRAAGQSARHRLGEGQHPSQRRAARLDRHRTDGARPARRAGVAGAGRGAHACGPLGRAGRFPRHRRLPRQPRLRTS